MEEIESESDEACRFDKSDPSAWLTFKNYLSLSKNLGLFALV